MTCVTTLLEPRWEAPVPAGDGGLSILVVDDNSVNLHLASRMLSRMGHRVSLASNGRLAIAMFATRRYDFVLMDLNMPDMGGVAAATAIRKLFPQSCARIVAFTATDDDWERKQCRAAGMAGFLTKPISRKDLANELGRLCAGVAIQ